MFIATDEPLPEQAPLKLRFRLGAGARVHEIEGRVVWTHLPGDDHAHTRGMGVEFSDPAARSLLARELEGLCTPSEGSDGAPDEGREAGSSRR
jgi:hypothetical protein